MSVKHLNRGGVRGLGDERYFAPDIRHRGFAGQLLRQAIDDASLYEISHRVPSVRRRMLGVPLLIMQDRHLAFRREPWDVIGSLYRLEILNQAVQWLATELETWRVMKRAKE